MLGVVVVALVSYTLFTGQDEKSLADELASGDLSAANQLASLQTVRAAELLAEAMDAGPPKVSAAATIALAKTTGWPQRDTRILAAAEHRHPETRQAVAIAVRCLAKRRPPDQLHDPKYTDYLLALLKDPSATVRASAARSLGRLNAFYAVPELMDQTVAETHALPRKAMQRALTAITRYKWFKFPADKRLLRKEFDGFLVDWRLQKRFRELKVAGKLKTAATLPASELPSEPKTPPPGGPPPPILKPGSRIRK